MFNPDPNKPNKAPFIKSLSTCGILLVLLFPLIAQAAGGPVFKIDFPEVGPTNIAQLTRSILNILLVGGIVVGVVYLILAGYKYITAGGDSEQASQAKNQIIGVVIGLIIILSSYAIINFVNQVLRGKLTQISFRLYEPSSTTNSSSGTSGGSTTSESGSATGPGATTEAQLPKIEPPSAPPRIDTPDQEETCPYTQQEFNSCFDLANKMYSCYKNAYDFLSSTDSPCNSSNLSSEGIQACNQLKDIVTYAAEYLQNSTTLCNTPVNKLMGDCLNGSRANPSQCQSKVSSLIQIIRGQRSREITRQTPTLSPYQKCLQKAREKYESCRNRTQEVCYLQKRAYEICLKGLGLITEKFCAARRRDYYECRNNWLRACSKQYSIDREYCRIHYRPY